MRNNLIKIIEHCDLLIGAIMNGHFRKRATQYKTD
jgi:hypothetical protein